MFFNQNSEWFAALVYTYVLIRDGVVFCVPNNIFP